MSFTVNPELLKMALEKIAVVPSDAAMMAAQPDPAQLGMQQPVDPAQAAMGAAPVDPSQDPTGAAAAAQPPAPAPAPAPVPAAPAAPGAAPGQQKLKPEQMMQMLDFRMYNMQQILTAIAQALNVQIDPSVLVMPPGTTGAPPAEAALPGGPMAPQQQDPNAAGGAAPPGGPLPPGGPQDPSQPPVDPNVAKQAWWEQAAEELPLNPEEPTEMQLKAAALSALRRSLGSAR